MSCPRQNTEKSKPTTSLIGLRRRRTLRTIGALVAAACGLCCSGDTDDSRAATGELAPVGKARIVLNDDSTPLAREHLLLARRPQHALQSMLGVRVPPDIATRQVFQARHQIEGVRWRRPELALHVPHHVSDLGFNVHRCTDQVDEGRTSHRTGY